MTGTEAIWVISRRWRVVLVTTLVGLTLAVLFRVGTDPAPTLYQAVHTMRVQPSAAVDAPVPDAVTPDTLDSVTDVALTPEVLRRVTADIGPQGDLSDLEVDPHPSRQTVDVVAVTEGEADRAVETANAVAKALMAELDARQKALHRQQLDSTKARLDALTTALRPPDPRAAGGLPQDVRDAQRDALLDTYADTFARNDELNAQAAPTAGLTTLTEAAGVRRLSGPGALGGRLPLVVATGLSGFFGALLAFALEGRGARVRAARGARRAFRLPVLAEIPSVLTDDEGAIAARDSETADAYRELRTALGVYLADGVAGNGHGVKPLVLVTSTTGGEGTSTAVANLAASMAEAGEPVVVLDCDFERPRLHEYLQAGEGLGLSDALAGVKRAQDIEKLAVATSVPGVRLVRAGTRLEHSAASLTRGGALVDQARSLGAAVIIDAPPMLASSDAFELAARADAVLVVCRDGETEVPAAERVGDKIDRLQRPVSGVVIMCTDGLPYGYSSGSWWEDDSGGPLNLFRGARAPAPPPPPSRPDGDGHKAVAVGEAPVRRPWPAVVRAWAPTVAVTLLLWLVIKTFAVESYAIPSSSMEPTLEPGDRVLVNKLSYRFGDVERGDVVVFDRPANLAAQEGVHDLIKRVIAVGGDTVEGGSDGRILVNGRPIAESYLADGITTAGLIRSTVPKGRVWVMGDNRGDSTDSRVFGAVPESEIVGRAFVQIWPPFSLETL